MTPSDQIHIPEDEIRWRFSRSAGPGGQNVNKVETRVELFFRPGASRSLSPAQRKTVVERLASRIDAEGDLHIVAADSRSQRQNRDTALIRLHDLLRQALRPRRVRLATRVPRGVREARLQEKRRRAQIKSGRSFQGDPGA